MSTNAKSKTMFTNSDKSAKSTKNKSDSRSSLIYVSEPAVYVIVNESLQMSKGKIAAQTAHGILKMNRFLIANNINHDNWLKTGEKIVVLKASKQIIDEIMSSYNEYIPVGNVLNMFPIFDAGRTQVEPGSLTVIVTNPINADKKTKLLDNLKLL